MRLHLAAIITFEHRMALYMINESVIIKRIHQRVELSRMACKQMDMCFGQLIRRGLHGMIEPNTCIHNYNMSCARVAFT